MSILKRTSVRTSLGLDQPLLLWKKKKVNKNLSRRSLWQQNTKRNYQVLKTYQKQFMQEINQTKTACSRSSWTYWCFHGKKILIISRWNTRKFDKNVVEVVHWPIFYYRQEIYSLTKQSKWTKSGRLKLINLAYLYSPAGMSSLICFI